MWLTFTNCLLKNSLAEKRCTWIAGVFLRGSQVFQRGAVAVMVLALTGCAAMQPAAVSNPVFVRANNESDAWERAVDVVHEYKFAIQRENRLDGMIETEYKSGAGWLQPWHRDSVGPHNRWQSTLQSIRRKAILSVTPVDGGYLVGVEAYKELEDVARTANSPGSSTFSENDPLRRDLRPVNGQLTPSQWIPLGRDPLLEQDILLTVQAMFP